MTNDELKKLINDRELLDFESSEQDFTHGLRLMLRDRVTGELGILQITPCGDPFEDVVEMSYSYQVTETAFTTPPVECSI